MELENVIARPNLWDDPESAQKVLQELNGLKEIVEPLMKLTRRVGDLRDFSELAAAEENPEAYEQEIEADLAPIRAEVDQLELATLLSGEFDSRSAILSINAGAGGTEACDWAEILLRMYLRWADRKSYKYQILDQTEGEIAGVKSVTVQINGRNAFGYLRNEQGVHRLVRISPFDANKRRHTSFASVDAVPVVEESDEVAIDPEELRVDTYRSSGAGGQNVQKNETAIRITHIPTGVVVTCQNERSQLQNRAVAMRVLQSRLLQMRRQEEEARLAELRGEHRAIEWGNQIRSYVFQPYTLVKDHRTGEETGNIIAVMEGEIDPFIQAALRQKGAER